MVPLFLVRVLIPKGIFTSLLPKLLPRATLSIILVMGRPLGPLNLGGVLAHWGPFGRPAEIRVGIFW